MASGYTECACRDCFEIVVSTDTDRPDFCDDCLTYACDTEHLIAVEHGSNGCECSQPDAYTSSFYLPHEVSIS